MEMKIKTFSPLKRGPKYMLSPLQQGDSKPPAYFTEATQGPVTTSHYHPLTAVHQEALK